MIIPFSTLYEIEECAMGGVRAAKSEPDFFVAQGLRVRAARHYFNLSEKDFRALSGIKTRKELCGIENGWRRMKEAHIQALCRRKRVSRLWLTIGVGPMFIERKNGRRAP